MINKKQMEEVKRIQDDELQWTIGNYGVFEYDVEIEDDLDLCMMNVNIDYRGNTVHLYIRIDQDGKSEINTYEDVYDDLDEAAIWRQIAFQFSDLLPTNDL